MINECDRIRHPFQYKLVPKRTLVCNNIVVCRQNLEEDWALMIRESGDEELMSRSWMLRIIHQMEDLVKKLQIVCHSIDQFLYEIATGIIRESSAHEKMISDDPLPNSDRF